MDNALAAGGSRRRSNKPRIYLTGRQHECALLAARGKTTEEIATATGLAHPTVRHHLDAARKKLGLDNKRQLHDRLAEVHVIVKEAQ